MQGKNGTVSGTKKESGILTRRVLDALEEGALSTLEIVEVILEAPYGTSAAGYEYRMRQKKRNRAFMPKVSTDDMRRCQNFIAYLQRDGLIEDANKNRSLFRIAGRGLLKLKQWRRDGKAPLPVIAYQKESAPTLLIVSFDIPEKRRYLRDWVRRALLATGFAKAQQSVYIGKSKLPKQLLQDMKHLDLARHVEIFQVTKRGSLRHIL